LQAFLFAAADEGAARLLPENAPPAPIQTTEDAYLQAVYEDGATGLEPATSGVTGRFWYLRARRE
jgi:hypothetical protein